MLKLSCLQRISIHCRKRVGYSEVAFVVEYEVPTAKQFSLPNCVAPKRNDFRYRIVRPAAKQLLLPNCVASSKSISLLIFYNRPPGHK